MIPHTELASALGSHVAVDNTVIVSLPLIVPSILSTVSLRILRITLPMLSPVLTSKTGTIADLDITFPNQVVSIESFTGGVLNIDLNLPLLAPSFIGAGNIDLSLPLITPSVNMLTGVMAQMNIALPRISIDLLGHLNGIGSLSVTLPSIIPSMTSMIHGIGSVNITLPFIEPRLTGMTGTVGSVDITLPNLSATIHSFINGILTMDITLPALAADIHGIYTPISVTYKGVVINTKTMAVTEYAGFNFKSLGNINGVVIGSNENGLFAFQGNDLSQSIIETGGFDFGKSNLQKPQASWLVLRADGALTMYVMTDENTVYEYDVTGLPNRLHEERVKFGKGIKGRVFSFGLKNVDKSDFNLADMSIFTDAIASKKR
jgi:hypothetical protein